MFDSRKAFKAGHKTEKNATHVCIHTHNILGMLISYEKQMKIPKYNIWANEI